MVLTSSNAVIATIEKSTRIFKHIFVLINYKNTFKTYFIVQTARITTPKKYELFIIYRLEH